MTVIKDGAGYRPTASGHRCPYASVMGFPEELYLRPVGRACHSRVREGDFAFPTGLPALHLAVRGFNRQSIKGIGLGRKMEDELLKSAWEIEALWAEPPQKVIADYKEKPEFKLGLQRSGKCRTNMGIAWPWLDSEPITRT
ncbi:hypothetical protein GW17_00045014 [Ensete ventricosum]|nr:hypothetical protein GW17_00045014 [Ensete ventricosum]